MEQNRITDKELQMILDYFKQFQIRLNEMNIDDLILKLKENRLTEKEKQEILEDFAEVRCADKRNVVYTEEDIKELLGHGKHDGMLRDEKDTFDDNMDQWPLMNKKSQKLTPEQIEAIVMKLKNDDAMFTKEEVNILANALINKMSLSIMHSARGASEDIWFYYMHGCWPRNDKRQFVPTEEEINELLGNGKHGGIVRKDTFDDNMDQWPLLHKKTQKFTPEQIEAVVMKLKNDDAMFSKEEVNILTNALINRMSLSIMHSVRGASEDIWFYYMHGCWPRDPKPNEFLQDHFFDKCYLTPEQIDRVIEVTRDKQWWEMSEREKKDILGNL